MTESKNTNVTFRSAKKCIAEEKISLNVSRLVVNPACRAGVRTSCPNLSALSYYVRPDEVVIAANQLEVIFEALLPSRLANRPPQWIRRTLSDREVQPFGASTVYCW